MSIEVKCDECGTKLRAPNRMIGKGAKCGGCNRRLVVMPADREQAAKLLARVAGEGQERWIRTDCHRCGKRIKAPSKWAGRKGHCPRCNAEVVMGQKPKSKRKKKGPKAPTPAEVQGEWIRQDCEGCGKRIKAPLSWAGKMGNCPRCGIEVLMGKDVLDDPSLDTKLEATGEISLDIDESQTGVLDEDAIVDTIEEYIRGREDDEEDFDNFDDLEEKKAARAAAGVPEVEDAGDSGVLDTSGLMDLYSESFGEEMTEQNFEEELPAGHIPDGPELRTEAQRQQLIRERAHQQRLSKIRRKHAREYRKYKRLGRKRQSYKVMLFKEQIHMRMNLVRTYMERERGTAGTVAVVILAICILFNAWIWLFSGDESGYVKVNQAYFYDLNTGELYTKDADLTPPIEAPSGVLLINGKETQVPAGVRAHLFSCTSCNDGEAAQWVGYIELYDSKKQEALQLLQAGQSIKSVSGADAGRNQSNASESAAPMIADPDERNWVRADTRDGLDLVRRIANRCMGGKPLRCTPPPRIER